jgi:hypothetical protein
MILLDRARLLWQFYVIDGIQGGRFAVYAKLELRSSTARLNSSNWLTISKPRTAAGEEPDEVRTTSRRQASQYLERCRGRQLDRNGADANS